MRKRHTALVLLSIVLVGCAAENAPPVSTPSVPAAGPPEAALSTLNIGRLEQVTIDGNDADWPADKGLQFDLLGPQANRFRSATDLDAKARLGWSDAGLLLLVYVQDDKAVEAAAMTDLWKEDGVEIFLASKPGARDFGQWVVTPGMSAEQPEPRWTFYEHRQDAELAKVEAGMTVARSKVAGGYVIEAMIPWDALAIKPELGAEVGVQIVVNDVDAPGENRYHAALYPNTATSSDSRQMYALRLADQAGPPVLARTYSDYDFDALQPLLTVVTGGVYAGRQAAVMQDGRVLAGGELKADDLGRCTVQLALPTPPQNQPYMGLQVVVADQPACRVDLPSSGQLARVRALRDDSERLRDKYGIDRPWDDLADAPALVRRHRGLVARVLSWLSGDSPLTGEQRLAALAEAVEQIAALEAGRDVYAQAGDRYLAAYYSSADGSGQPFVVRVPEDYDPAKSYPLFVILHGLGGRPAPTDLRPAKGSLTVMPWGRGDLRWVGLAERDVLDVIRYAMTWYNIDPDRVYVDGGSMGGRGTWVMSTRHPDLFAAAAPLFGWADGLPLENLRNVPIFVMHGGSDWVVCVDHSRYAVSRLAQMGYNVAHKEFPEAGHFIPRGEDFTGDWMLTLTRPAVPEAITYTCQSESQGKAYWLSVRRMTDPHEPATVKARVLGKGPYQMVTVLTENISVLELDLTKMGLDRNERLLVQVGQTHLERAAPLPDRLFVVRAEAEASLADEWNPPGAGQRAYQPGAAANLYTGEPLLIVYGTKGDEPRTRLLRQSAQKLAGFGGFLDTDMAAGNIPVKADRELTDEDMARYNLVLIGLAQDNAVTERLMDKLPLAINDKNELLTRGREPVSLNEAGLRLFYYNPLAPRRLIFVLGANDDGPKARQWYLNPDRLMTGADGESRNCQADLVVQTLDQALRRRMQFDHDWQWRQVAGADKPAPANLASRRAFLRAVAEVTRRTGEADYGFEAGASENRRMYDPQYFTQADLRIEYAGPQQVLVAEMTGEELLDVHRRWVSRGQLTASPDYAPEDIDAQRVYRVALSPALCWTLKNRQKNLTNVTAGPDWLPADLWQSVLAD